MKSKTIKKAPVKKAAKKEASKILSVTGSLMVIEPFSIKLGTTDKTNLEAGVNPKMVNVAKVKTVGPKVTDYKVGDMVWFKVYDTDVLLDEKEKEFTFIDQSLVYGKYE